eukprot:1304300-Prymnesium_polylepis.1
MLAAPDAPIQPGEDGVPPALHSQPSRLHQRHVATRARRGGRVGPQPRHLALRRQRCPMARGV